MPYIKDDIRAGLVTGAPAVLPGELNYQLTRVIKAYMDNHGRNYTTFNDISGAMTECLAEFRRRVIAPYEDKKMVENGDVYD